jgi:septum formation protein
MRLLLASKSDARRRMLEAAGVPFRIAEAELDEAAAKGGLEAAGFEPRGIAEELAQLKALSVSAQSDALVLGSDQTLELDDGSMMSKPGSREEALDQLSALGGRTHFLHSSAVVAEGGEAVWWHCETAQMTMRRLSREFLEDYLDREFEHIRWSVGGYRIEGLGVQLFERIEGSHFAILGLPLIPVLGYLRERGLLKS